VSGVALSLPAQSEPALGMAVLARAAVTADQAGDAEPDLVAAADTMVRITEVVEPRADGALEERYGVFRAALADRGWVGRDRVGG
jgi:hypothetical protein